MLPEDIEIRIRDYLLLEFGEDGDDPDALKLEDLKYEGEHAIDGSSVHCWSFPTTPDDTWASVELIEDSYVIGMVANPNFKPEVTYDYVWLEIWDGKAKNVKVPLVSDENQTVYFEDDYLVTFKSGLSLTVYVEIEMSSTPYEFTVAIKHGDQDITLNGETKGIVDYDLNESTGIKVVVGGEKWL